LQKKSKSKAFRKQIASNFLVVAHARHPTLRASVSTWEGLLCRLSMSGSSRQLAIALQVRVN